MQPEPSLSPGRLRFGDFEVDVESHELRRLGRRVRLQEKSFLVLHELLKSPGRVVTREELAAALWPKELYVDAEHGLNTAVRRLREALGDSADEARYVETLPKLGYRFIGVIEERAEAIAPPAIGDSPPEIERASPALPPIAPPSVSAPEAAAQSPRRYALGAAAILVGVALTLLAIVGARSRSTPPEASATAPAPRQGSSETVDELLARARYLRNHKRFAEAKQFVEEALKLDPKNPEALAGLAMGLMSERQYDQARETARRALELDPDAWEAHRVLANLALWVGDLASAERHFRRAADANPADPKARNRLARHLLECGRIEQAKEQMLESKRLDPEDPDVQNIWIELALFTGDYESAIRQGEIWFAVWGKQLTGGDAMAVRRMLGMAYMGARRQEDALAQFRVIDPDDDLQEALIQGYAGRTGEARAILEAHEVRAAAAGMAADPALAVGMAMAYVVIGDFDRAFAQLDRQVAARWYPGWLHIPLFHSIRNDERWPAFAERLEAEFFRGKQEAVVLSRRERGVQAGPPTVFSRPGTPIGIPSPASKGS